MALNSNALVSLATVKTFLNISDTSFDTELERLINTASESIARRTRRVLITTTHTEYHDGRRTNRILLREYPITGGPADGNTKPQVFLDSGSDFPASSELDTEHVRVSDEDNMILKLNGTFPLGTKNIKVIYEAGVGTLGSLPSDLENACIEYVSWMFNRNNDRRIGIETKSKLGETITFIQGIPKFIDDLLQPYLRSEFPVSNIPVINY
jgi:uncharacterized phiE125 gp8 family phage protein